jgi:hypothetical protein
VASRQTIGMRCDAPRAGPFTISVSREAGSGDVDVRVSGKITQTTAR